MKHFFGIVVVPVIIALLFYSCGQVQNDHQKQEKQPVIYLGADLSYVNEMENCGGIYRKDGKAVDPYALFSEEGANIVRLRLWHTPEWSGYSDFADVKKSIRRAKENNMAVLLDFHYSDTWADPQKQIIPEAWENIENPDLLGDSLYQYTLNTLLKLAEEDLYPEFVQVGNETNIEILQQENNMLTDTINWARNVFLLSKGIEAVRKANKKAGFEAEIMIHIAQPENADPWFDQALVHGLKGFDWIGLSWYPKWSVLNMKQVPAVIKDLKVKYNKRIMIVETAYPYTLENADPANNLMGADALHEGYPATPQGQLDFMVDLTEKTLKAGAEGVIYWEPAWISTKCTTPWGQGSHWENATFFNAAAKNEMLPVFGFLGVGKQ